MSDNALAMFDGANVPAHIGGFMGEMGDNIAEKATVPSLSYTGKVWSISLDGSKTQLMRRNDDGDEEPVTTMRLVILDYAKRRGRAYYEGTYDPNNTSPPKCWSDDGIAPDASVPADDKQSAKCDSCPMAVKGSKISDNGKATVACSSHRMLAVVPANKLDFTPLRLKIAITSDWDKNSPDAEKQNWRAFQQHLDFLKARGVGHTAAMVTKVKFDPSEAYPKLFFSPDRWLEQEEVNKIAPIVKSDDVQKLLGGTYTPDGADGVAKSEQVTETAAAKSPEPTPTPAPAPQQEAASMVIEAEPKEAAKEEAAAPAEKKANEAAPDASNDVPDEVAALLADWG